MSGKAGPTQCASANEATLADFIAYEQETQRFPSDTGFNPTLNQTPAAAISSNLDDRTMHELYLWPFQNAVHSGVASIMCSYNRINSSYACQNSKTMNGLLKGELGFQGYVSIETLATVCDSVMSRHADGQNTGHV